MTEDAQPSASEPAQAEAPPLHSPTDAAESPRTPEGASESEDSKPPDSEAAGARVVHVAGDAHVQMSGQHITLRAQNVYVRGSQSAPAKSAAKGPVTVSASKPAKAHAPPPPAPSAEQPSNTDSDAVGVTAAPTRTTAAVSKPPVAAAAAKGSADKSLERERGDKVYEVDVAKCAKNALLALAAATAVRATWRVARWQWVATRVRGAIAGGDVALLEFFLTHRCERVARAALRTLACDAAAASAARTASPAAAAAFPVVPDRALSRGSHTALRASSTAAAVAAASVDSSAGGAKGAPPFGVVGGDAAALPARTPSLSVISSSSGEAGRASDSDRVSSPGLSEAAYSAPSFPLTQTALEHSLCSGKVSDVAAADAPLPARLSRTAAAVEGRVVQLLVTQPRVAAATVAAIRRMLSSARDAAQRDGAEAVQLLAFCGDGVGQLLINEGVVELLARSLQHVRGMRRRGGTVLRQPARHRHLAPDAAATVHTVARWAPHCVFGVHNGIPFVDVHKGFVRNAAAATSNILGLRLENGRALVAAECRVGRRKRAAAAGALQNLAALRGGSRAILDSELALQALCSSAIICGSLGALAVLETLQSVLHHYPLERQAVFRAGADHVVSATASVFKNRPLIYTASLDLYNKMDLERVDLQNGRMYG